jgi:FkbM family methyltransferase
MELDTLPARHIGAFLKKAIPEQYHRPISGIMGRIRGYRLESYSQCGEDLALRWLFDSVSKGFYVDVGACHPKRFSNTYYFYKRGWTGINIDPTPGFIELFRKARPRDINLPYAVASSARDLKLYINESEPCVNTLSPDFAALQRERWGRRYSFETVVRTHTLAEILHAHKPDDRPIQFLSVDVEGLDLEVLESNDWKKYVPNVILCEDLTLRNVECGSRSDVWAFLRARGYGLVAKCVHTLVFAHTAYKTFD